MISFLTMIKQFYFSYQIYRRTKSSKTNLRIKSIVAASLRHDNRWCTATNLAHHARATCTEYNGQDNKYDGNRGEHGNQMVDHGYAIFVVVWDMIDGAVEPISSSF